MFLTSAPAFLRPAFSAIVALLLATLCLPAVAQIKLVASQPVVVRSGSGIGRLKLSNTSPSPQPLKLSVGLFVDETSRSRVEQPKTSFVLESGGDLPPVLAPGQSLEIAVDLSGISGALSVDAPLYNGGNLLGAVRAVAVDTPLNVALDGRGTPDQPLEFTFAKSAVIPLKNSGKDYLALDWRFLVGGTQEGSGMTILPPDSQSRIVLSPTAEVYTPIDFFRPATRSGVLLLRPHTSSGVDPRLFDLHPIPVTLRMNRLGPETTETLFAVYVMFFLFIGGALSLLANSILPNMLKRIAFEKQLARLADRTSSVSYRVDSYVRVLLRLERKKIEFALKDATWYSLSIAEKVDAVAIDVARLDLRLTLAEKTDQLRRRFEEISASAPPSATDLVDQVLQSATEQLHSFTLPEDVLNEANTLLAKADAEMDALADTGQQSKRVAANFKELKTRLGIFPKDLYPDLEAALTGVFMVFTFAFDDPANIVPPMLFAIDHAIAAGHILLDYALVRATIAKGATKECPTAGKEAAERLLARECRLIDLLGTLSWKALREARILVQEMRENVYEEDIIEGLWKREVDKKPAARIVFDTQRARPYLPIYFSVDFDNPHFRNAAALSCLGFRWTFPGDLVEEGSRVCHYFIGNEPEIPLGWDVDDVEKIAAHKHHSHDSKQEKQQDSWLSRRWRKWKDKRRRGRRGFTTWITVTVQKQHDVSMAARIHEKIKLDPHKRPGKSRVWVEIVRFLLAFGVALAGIEAGAIDQLRKLDFLAGTIAVVALGFGADSIKNLLTQTPKKTA
ncbi:hypothetical protein DYQ86_12280 [Acidobacteria bacterium AB60]|nr:hypothetical protein DYQ86_12280 [Acidobacteria bacterium AB60]